MVSLDELDRLVLPAAGYWHKRESQVPRYTFGKGAIKEFTWYFQGKSQVKVSSLREICKWLSRCKYLSDMELFVEEDFWQHPVTFEHLKKGDCEDHALWAWRKLTELKIPSEFVCGRWLEKKNGCVTETGHAWVNFYWEQKKLWHVLECTEKNQNRMILPFQKAAEYYFPEVSIDGKLSTYRYTIAKKRRGK